MKTTIKHSEMLLISTTTNLDKYIKTMDRVDELFPTHWNWLTREISYNSKGITQDTSILVIEKRFHKHNHLQTEFDIEHQFDNRDEKFYRKEILLIETEFDTSTRIHANTIPIDKCAIEKLAFQLAKKGTSCSVKHFTRLLYQKFADTIWFEKNEFDGPLEDIACGVAKYLMLVILKDNLADVKKDRVNTTTRNADDDLLLITNIFEASGEEIMTKLKGKLKIAELALLLVYNEIKTTPPSLQKIAMALLDTTSDSTHEVLSRYIRKFRDTDGRTNVTERKGGWNIRRIDKILPFLRGNAKKLAEYDLKTLKQRT